MIPIIILGGGGIIYRSCVLNDNLKLHTILLKRAKEDRQFINELI